MAGEHNRGYNGFTLQYITEPCCWRTGHQLDSERGQRVSDARYQSSTFRRSCGMVRYVHLSLTELGYQHMSPTPHSMHANILKGIRPLVRDPNAKNTESLV